MQKYGEGRWIGGLDYQKDLDDFASDPKGGCIPIGSSVASLWMI